jgi:hypothetical protein
MCGGSKMFHDSRQTTASLTRITHELFERRLVKKLFCKISFLSRQIFTEATDKLMALACSHSVVFKYPDVSGELLPPALG